MSRNKHVEPEYVEVDASLINESDGAYLIEDAEGKEHWVPKSLARYDHGTIEVQEWKAQELGLI